MSNEEAAAPAEPEPVPTIELPSVDIFAPTDRSGYDFRISGDSLRTGKGSIWTPEQYQNGIRVWFNYLSSTEEEDAVVAAARVGKSAVVGSFMVKMALAYVDGKKVPHMERPGMWEQLGMKGRHLCVIGWQLATAPSEAARALLVETFRASP